LLFIEERRFHEALPYANYIIYHLSNYKPAYNLKAQALTGLGKLTEALDIYKKVLSLAPNYSDAHVGRLALLVKLVQEREDNISVWVEQFLVAYELAVKADPEVGDKVDDEVRRLFQTESRRDNERHVSAAQLPAPDVID
jgi:tetratricopeptide (TPR) repeat protein